MTTTPQLDPMPIPPTGARLTPHPDVTTPGARVIAYDPERPGVYTIAVATCACGTADAGVCDCNSFAAGLAGVRPVRVEAVISRG